MLLVLCTVSESRPSAVFPAETVIGAVPVSAPLKLAEPPPLEPLEEVPPQAAAIAATANARLYPRIQFPQYFVQAPSMALARPFSTGSVGAGCNR